jgi:hypothetical protein
MLIRSAVVGSNTPIDRGAHFGGASSLGATTGAEVPKRKATA